MTKLNPLPIEVFATWLASGERGISSEAMVSQITAQRVGRGNWRADHPHDLGDFKRCEKLLRQVPLARFYLPVVADRSPVWQRLVDAWDELVELAEAEVPGAFSENRTNGSAPKAAARLRAIIHDE